MAPFLMRHTPLRDAMEYGIVVMPTTRERGAMPTCDCTDHADTGTHGYDCIHWDLPTDDPSDHYGL